MTDGSVSFFLECDREWNITKLYWYEPVYLISPYEINLLSLFTEAEGDNSEKRLAMFASEEAGRICEVRFHLKNTEAEVALCVLPVDGRVLVYGQDSSVFDGGCSAETIKEVVHKFMKSISTMNGDFIGDNERTIRNQFEQIQKLNSNLINAQREISKANARLNQVNEDLNNRLVKDPLTGLVSRYQYRAEIQLAIAKSPDKQGIYAFIDIDYFKNVNDTYGHAAGDAFLKEFANRLMQLPYENMICMRIAGDEFGLYLHGYDAVGNADTADVWQKIKEYVLKEPVALEGTALPIRCSVGFSVFGRDTHNVYDLIEYADFAMYEAKKNGKNAYSDFSIERYEEKKAK